MFVERLAKLIDESELSNNKLSKQLNVTQQLLSYWLNKDVKPKKTSLICLAKFFHVPTDYLLGLTDEVEPKNWIGEDNSSLE